MRRHGNGSATRREPGRRYCALAHPNSGLPEFGTLSARACPSLALQVGRSRIDPTSAGRGSRGDTAFVSTAVSPENQSAVVGNDRRPRFIVSGLLFAMT